MFHAAINSTHKRALIRKLSHILLKLSQTPSSSSLKDTKGSIVHVTKSDTANIQKTATQMPNKVKALPCWQVFKTPSL